jgi:hypothetical protein
MWAFLGYFFVGWVKLYGLWYSFGVWVKLCSFGIPFISAALGPRGCGGLQREQEALLILHYFTFCVTSYVLVTYSKTNYI